MRVVPGIVIAGTHSGVGKTTIATALMAALTRRGLRVQPFKAGPDFIDPSFHHLATGRRCHNLDGWMLTRSQNTELFARACEDADIALIEGVMGLFDGQNATTETGSSAEVAKWLGCPVLLVVDASAMARSVAALVRGFEVFDPALSFLGVVFNRVDSEGHFTLLDQALRSSNSQVPALGYLPRNDRIAIPERHLGLVTADEFMTPQKLAAMADWVEASLDLDRLVDMARAATRCAVERAEPMPHDSAGHPARIGIARDSAFCFYYQDNLDLLCSLGAELVEFSPVDDARLPAGLDGLYLGGGYPELYAPRLSANQSMRRDVLAFAQSGAPVYAECGGFMYLTDAIVDTDGNGHAMVGVFPTRARMQKNLAAIGYIEVETKHGSWLPAGQLIRGHQFRYSTVDAMPRSIERCYRVSTAASTDDGFALGSVVAGYTHLHFRSAPHFAASFVAASRSRRNATTTSN